MTEPRPTYNVPASMVEALDAKRDADRRQLTNDALRHAGAAERALLALVAYINDVRGHVGRGELDDAALRAAVEQLRDLRQCAEALGVGLS